MLMQHDRTMRSNFSRTKIGSEAAANLKEGRLTLNKPWLSRGLLTQDDEEKNRILVSFSSVCGIGYQNQISLDKAN